MSAVWLEVALNGAWGQARQPLMPIRVKDIVAEGIACAKEGAAIIHVHAYDEDSGTQNDDWQIYARIIEGIRNGCDSLVYPTIPLSGSGYANNHAEMRFKHVHELAKRGLIEMTVLDTGSVNFIRYDQMDDIKNGFIYMNPPGDIESGFEIANQYNLVPGYAIYEPGFTRLAAALTRKNSLKRKPVYRFMFSEEFAWGFPPSVQFLESHLALLHAEDPDAHWMIAGLGVDISPLIEQTVKKYGHIRVGLEDAPWGTTLRNIDWVRKTVQAIKHYGANPAPARDVRQTLEFI
mgnify:CR=1 FL=1